MITDRQTRLLRQKRMEGKTQETAAAKAGMSVRSARKWQSGPLPSQAKPEHRWRTRPDPFDGVCEDEIEPLLRNDPTGKLKATTIIDCPSTSSGGRAASWAVQRIPAADAACCLVVVHHPDRQIASGRRSLCASATPSTWPERSPAIEGPAAAAAESFP